MKLISFFKANIVTGRKNQHWGTLLKSTGRGAGVVSQAEEGDSDAVVCERRAQGCDSREPERDGGTPGQCAAADKGVGSAGDHTEHLYTWPLQGRFVKHLHIWILKLLLPSGYG